MARTHDMDRKHMMETFRRAHAHQGAAFVEIYQNCNVFNDGAFETITAKANRDDMLIPLVHGEPIRFGADSEQGVAMGPNGALEIVDVADVGEDNLLVHDESRRPRPRLHALAAGRRPDPSRRRSACSVPSSGPSTPKRPASSWPRPRRRGAPATSRPSCTPGATWDVD